MDRYIKATDEAGKDFYRNFQGQGKIVMLNLLKFRQWADYSNVEQLKPANEITGEEAYQLYMESILPLFNKAGTRIVYYGKSKSFLIGPDNEHWDAVLLVEYESVSKFMELVQDEDYLKNAGHRTAALEDSRLLPSSEIGKDD